MEKELYAFLRELQTNMNYTRYNNLLTANEVEAIDFSKLKPDENFFPSRGPNTVYKTNMLLEKEHDIKKHFYLMKILNE